MFADITYTKGAAVVHTLRRRLGDAAFFAGLHHYLTKYSHQPVDSHDFCDAMSEATGVNLEPFFDRWVYKPGHPVLDYVWRWEEPQKQVVLNVRQTQPTNEGVPVYDIDATVGLISGGQLRRERVKLDRGEQEARIACPSKPDAVLLDPDHDFLRETPALHWSPEELPHIARYAPNSVDRENALGQMLAGTPSTAAIELAFRLLRSDRSSYPALVAQGDKDSPILTERQRRFVNPKGNSQMSARLKTLKSFVLLGCDDVRAKKLVLNGQQIVENCYYRMMTGEEAPLV